jgi:4-diphosphocytidyl-2-C-methyl-D-erythritol kinase
VESRARHGAGKRGSAGHPEENRRRPGGRPARDRSGAQRFGAGRPRSGRAEERRRLSGVRLFRAPAKVNLTLHILRRDDEGWHELDSIVAFAGAADWLRFEPGDELALTIDGPRASAACDGADNLVLKAARALAARIPGLRLGRFHLTKNLPVAAGLGGGSSDAAAALRALAWRNGLGLDDARLRAAAAAAGSDVPVCLEPRLRTMRGRGEIVGPPLGWPPLFAVLANPGISAPTARVFASLGLARGETMSAPAAAPDASDPAGIAAALAAGRNDLEQAARAIAPQIGEALAALARSPGAKRARMSGSGATCFALFDNRRAAVLAAQSLAVRKPGWWVRATLLR